MSSTTTTATPAAAPVELSTPIELSARHEKAVQNFKETLTDPFTNHVINSMGPETPERAREVFTSMIQHLHAFARDIQLLSPEWLLGVNTLNRAGQMSDENRNEGILVSDIVGLEALVDQITQKTLVKMSEGVVKAATFSAILGPFFRENAPRYPNGTDIVQKHLPNNPTVFMDGHIYDSETGNPVVGADIDLWHTNSNGLYDQQDPDQPDYNNRGKFTTDKDGYYSLKAGPGYNPTPDRVLTFSRSAWHPPATLSPLTAPPAKFLSSRADSKPPPTPLHLCNTNPSQSHETRAHAHHGPQGRLHHPGNANLRLPRPVHA